MGWIVLVLTMTLGLANAEDYKKCTSSDCSGKAACVTIYQHRDFGGWFQCYPIRNDNDCVKFSDWWTYSGSRVSGVDTHDTCIRLHEKSDCTGYSLELKPGVKDHGYLNSHNFEDLARSVSSCKREEKHDNCYVKTLFSPHLDAKRVSTESDKMLESMDKLGSLVVFGFATVIPGLDLFYSGLQFVADLFKDEKSIGAIIDEKIAEGFETNSASQISAKMRAVNNRLTDVLNKATPDAGRRNELRIALHTCEEIKHLFEDKKYSFNKNRIASAPYVVSFSTVYLSVAKLAYDLLPDKRARVIEDMNGLISLNRNAMNDAISQRKEKFTWNYWPRSVPISSGYIVEDRLVCKPMEKGERRTPKECNLYRLCGKSHWAHCEMCLKSIKDSIEKEIRGFFKPIINKLERFP